MIQLLDVTKKFDTEVALDHVSLHISESQICGLLGTNGAGKSTMMRLICGVEKCDNGSIQIDGQEAFDNVDVKKEIYFCSDDPFYFGHSNGLDMAKYLESVYDSFQMELFLKWMDIFRLDPKKRIGTFSKGKKKQLSILLGLAAHTKYLFCDETFDGLDPAMRQAVKTLLIGEMAERDLTVIVSSHNLRELEDICDNVILLHDGNVLISKAIDEMKAQRHKVQCVFSDEKDFERLKENLEIQNVKKSDTMYSFVAFGNSTKVSKAFEEFTMAYFEMMPLSLEEVFIMETEVAGYDIKKILLETM